MRVIAGKARRLPLKTLEGLDTRPTTDRIKETLFNMINTELYDCDFLDLFSGSGGIGIEALSRGAKKAYFIENNKAAIACIKENLNFTKLVEYASIIESDVLSGLRRLENNAIIFDFIFMDPPFNKELEKQVLDYLRTSSLIDENTTIIVEADLKTSFDYLEEFGFSLLKNKEYKTNKHVFIGLRER